MFLDLRDAEDFMSRTETMLTQEEMKFTKEKELYLACMNGEKRRITKFLWWPVTVQNQETRWLERATIEYKADWEEGIFTGRYYYWRPWKFIDESE